MSDRSEVKFDASDDVGPSVAPVGNDALPFVLLLDHLLPLISVLGISVHSFDLLQARLSGHELKNAVHAEHCASFGINGGGLESFPDEKGCIFHDYFILHVEEARRPANLLEVGSTEGLVDDGVQDLAGNGRLDLRARLPT